MNVTDKVINLDTSRLRIAEQIEFFSLVVYIVEKYNPQQKDIINASEPFKKACQDVESRYKKERNHKLTRELAEKDKLRDSDIICLRMMADALTRHFEAEVRDAALSLLATIDKYGSVIYNMNYEEETVVLRNLIADIKSNPNLMEALKKFNLKPVVANLEKNNDAFQDLYKIRLEEMASNTEISAGESLKKTDLEYRILIRTLESKAFLAPTENVNKTIAEINILIDRQLEKLQNRESRREI